ncbi:hypothetical protein H6G17_08920 [Chroococcidiopsis sp. FACHB-1243]|uniref:hypothetical protein n=1 Tax=Chroococcidiopsis sp. [FACHB-1243] TaxID=2692781 RepID=UPI001780F5A5|nr:hypothetical protein [Chroococcidiopsis sp. [FACHB-1243]]MBD2305638.1 hypothetical protein [Chroococcidiopsis sp. [FACHB-1243]]
MIPTKLQTRIQSLKQQRDRAMEEKALRQQQELAILSQKLLAEFSEKFNADFDPEIRSELGIELKTERVSTASQIDNVVAYAEFLLTDELEETHAVAIHQVNSWWRIRYPDLAWIERHKRRESQEFLHIDSAYCSRVKAKSASEVLLLFLHGWQQLVKENAQKRQEESRRLEELAKKRQQEEEEQEALRLKNEREQAELQQQWEEQATAIKAEDTQIRQRIAAELSEAKSQLWQWQEGATVTLYKWTWCKGAYERENDETEFDYEYLWSDRDSLDEDGYVTGYKSGKQDGYSYRACACCQVKLIADVHKPVIERVQYCSWEDLPSIFRTPIFHTFQGIQLYGDYDWQVLELIAQAQEEDEEWYRQNPACSETIAIGEEPLPWIKSLLDNSK